MIEVQIATTVSEDGVGGICWVLLDPSEVALPAGAVQQAPTDPPAAPDVDAADPRPARWVYHLLRALVLAAALAAAWWTASGSAGPPAPVTKGTLARSGVLR